MSKIKLDSEWGIEISDLNFTLSFRREKEIMKKNKETGIEELKTVTEKGDYYFPHIEGCLRKYLTESLRESKDIQDILDRIDAVHTTIKTLKC